MTTLIEEYPGSASVPPLEQVQEGGVDFDVFELENPNSPGNTERVSVHNTQAFNDLVGRGLDAVPDENLVIFKSGRSNKIHAIYRHGDQFTYRQSSDDIEGLGITSPPVNSNEENLNVDFSQILPELDSLGGITFGFDSTAPMVSRGDSLGQAFRDMGFSPTEGVYPTPSGLNDRLQQIATSSGKAMPHIRFFEEGVIPGEQYVSSFAQGEYPASSKLSWYGHDIASDHFRAVVVHGEEAMLVAQLYAQAVLGSEEIMGRIYPDEYEINKGAQAQKVEVTMSGDEKIKHAALCIDQFTSELDGLTRFLDSEPAPGVSIAPPEHMDFAAEMVSVILSSPEHRVQLIEYLESRGSEALTADSLNYDVYLQELLELARSRWGIKAEPYSEPVQTAPKNEGSLYL